MNDKDETKTIPALDLAEILRKRHKNEEAYYGSPISSLLLDAAEELERLYYAHKNVSDAWGRAEFRIAEKQSEIIKLRSGLPNLPGWRLVPVEPTPDMIEAACRDGVDLDGRPVWKHTYDVQAKWRWKQMLDAAPTPDTVGTEIEIGRSVK